MKKSKSLDHINNLNISKIRFHNNNNIYKSNEYREKLSIRSAKATPVEVLKNKTNINHTFSSASKAAVFIGCHKDTISNKLRLSSNTSIFNRYYVKH